MNRLEGKKILVTGGTGFIGAALVRRLVALGARVRVLDDDSRGSPRRLGDVLSRVEMVPGDVRDASTVSDAVRGVDSVHHLAYVNGTEFFYSHPDLVLDVGVKGIVNVLDACRAHGVRELVLASSSEAYHVPPVVPTPEEVPLVVPDPYNPRYSYGGGKIISELMAIHCGGKFLERVIIFRPHNVYGPDMGWEHVIPQFAMRVHALTNDRRDPLPFPIQGSGGETRAFVHIDDFVDGLVLVLQKGDGGTYHIGNPAEVTVGELAALVAKTLGRRIEIVPGRLQAGGTPRRCPDISKLKGLGFEPRVSLEAGVAATAAWYVANASLAPRAADKHP